MDGLSDIEEERRLVLDKPLELQNSRNKRNGFIYLVTMLSAIGGFLFGYDTGVVSGAMVFIRDDFQLDNWWQEFIVSATILSAWIFSMIAGYLTEKFGRKLVILLASLIFTFGAIVMSIAWNKFVLLFGRFIVGSAIGLASMTIPIYIAEVAPIDIRGRLVTINNCFITGGQFVASLIAGVFSSNSSSGWRYMLGMAAIPSFIQLVFFIVMPESPRWLIRRGRYQEALEALQKLRGPDADINEEFESIKENCLASEREQAEKGGTSVFEQIMQNTGLRRALLIGCALQMVQQISGINTVMYYSATIIQMSGVHNNSTAVWLSAATASVNFVFTFVGLVLVERIGRRLLTLLSLAGVIVSLIVLALGFQLTAIESPGIGWRYDYTKDTTCYKMNTCFDCIQSKSCGFCFIDNSSTLSSSIDVNGTCLLADPDNHERASGKLNALYLLLQFNHFLLIILKLLPLLYSWFTSLSKRNSW
jgi:SP family myo-inositol transporter-like MFS transporter 13